MATSGSPERWKEPPLPEDAVLMVTGFSIESLPPSKLLPKSDKKGKSRKTASSPQVVPSEPLSGSDDVPSSGPEFMDLEYSSDSEAHVNGTHAVQESDGESAVANDAAPDTITPPPEQKLKLRLKTSLFDEVVRESNIRRRSSRKSEDGFNYYEQARINMGMGKRPRTPERADTPKLESDQEEPKDAVTGSKDLSYPPIKKIKISSPRKPTTPNGYAQSKQESFARQARQSNIPAVAEDRTIENQDFCSVCGGAGKFLCCETCPRSFHFSCVDPPLDEDSLPEGEWNCHECYTKRHPPLPYKKGFLFSKLLNQLQRSNPRQFQLPKKLRERYENVGVSKEGAYIEEHRGSTGRKVIHNRQEDDPLRLFDKNGEVALCFKCQKSALNGTQMVNCDFCNSFWHVDCLDPPLYAVGPTWKCPNHSDQAAKLPRRPKKAKVTDVSLRRGFKNQGVIEVLSEDEEENDDVVQKIPFFDIRDRENEIYAPVPKSVGKAVNIDDIVYRLPAEGIKLDFIDAVKKSNRDPLEQTRTSDILVALDELALRPFEERQGVRDLCFLQMNNSKHVISANARENLLNLLEAALTAQDEPAKDNVGVVKEEDTHSPVSSDSVANTASDEKANESINSDELSKLLAIKKLMEAKGKDKMMKFLLEG